MKQLSTSFFYWQHAKIVWRIVHITTGINHKDSLLISVGATALMWAIWCTRNDLIFEKNKNRLPLLCGYFQGSILAAILVPT